MRNYRGFQLFLLAVATGCLFLVSSCMKKEVYPDVPVIAFQSFVEEFDTGKYATRGYLTITFKDGNGDIGLLPGQTQPPFDSGSPYYYNYIIDYYEKQNGSFVKLVTTVPFSARIPYLTPDDPSPSAPQHRPAPHNAKSRPPRFAGPTVPKKRRPL